VSLLFVYSSDRFVAWVGKIPAHAGASYGAWMLLMLVPSDFDVSQGDAGAWDATSASSSANGQLLSACPHLPPL